MTEVIFVEVTQNLMEMRACAIAERTYVKGDRLQIIAADQQQAVRLDSLLWTFRPDSFVPHGLLEGEKDDNVPPVLICAREERFPGFDFLLMLDYCPVEIVGQFSNAIHLVVLDNPERLEASRRYWSQLKEAGFTLRHQRR